MCVGVGVLSKRRACPVHLGLIYELLESFPKVCLNSL